MHKPVRRFCAAAVWHNLLGHRRWKPLTERELVTERDGQFWCNVCNDDESDRVVGPFMTRAMAYAWLDLEYFSDRPRADGVCE